MLRVIVCLMVVINLILMVIIVVKQGKCHFTTTKAMDYPSESCAYNCQTPYGDDLSPEECAAECNANPNTGNDCCGSVCDYDTTTKTFGNCNPPSGLHCGSPQYNC